MARPNRFQLMKRKSKLIKKAFKQMKRQVFSIPDLQKVFRNKRDDWNLPAKTKTEEFINHLLENQVIEAVKVKLPREEELSKYIVGEPSLFELALSIKSRSYLSHYSAMFLHDLTDNVPKVIYTNTELKKSGTKSSGKLEQANINRAFSCNMRQSNQIAWYENTGIYLLNSKNVDRIGVKEITYNKVKLHITGLERTLIDITVRPNYAGGTAEVLNAFREAKGRISVNKLAAILKKLDYVYPYHQAIGFYLERAGYEESALKLMEKKEIKFDFFLTYKMKDPDYSERWRLFHPRAF